MLHDVIEGLVEVHQKRQIENHFVRRAQIADRFSEVVLNFASQQRLQSLTIWRLTAAVFFPSCFATGV